MPTLRRIRNPKPETRNASILALLLLLALPAQAQQDGLLQLDDPLHRLLTRQQTLGRLAQAFLSHQPLSAYEARRYVDSLDRATLGRVDRRLYDRARGDAPGPGVATLHRALAFPYRNGHDFIAARGDGYGVQINPLFYLSYGRARRTAREGRDAVLPVWQNTRGVRVSGHVGRHVFFESRLEENQRRDAWPAFAHGTAPRLGSTKFDADGGFYDYWRAMGVVGVHTEHVEVRFGRDRNRWGPGQTSLLVSDYAPAYDQLQVRTTFWRFQYANLFAGLAYPNAGASGFVPHRFGAFHRLAVNLPGRLQAEAFEAVVFVPSDSLGVRDGAFDIGYLNPVIFYRAVEADRGSPDNVLLGTGLAWTAAPGLRLYGQFLLDELDVDRIGKGWWANKWGWLAGVHAVPLPALSLRAEYARLRPYLYSHFNPSSAYLHFDDLLGHPAGPNARDVAVFVDYQPTPRLRAAVTLAYTVRGRDTETENYGSDPARSSNSRVADTDVRFLQGIRQTHGLVEVHVDGEVLPHLYLEAALRAEWLDDAATGTDRYVAPHLTLRWGLPFQSLRY